MPCILNKHCPHCAVDAFEDKQADLCQIDNMKMVKRANGQVGYGMGDAKGFAKE